MRQYRVIESAEGRERGRMKGDVVMQSEKEEYGPKVIIISQPGIAEGYETIKRTIKEERKTLNCAGDGNRNKKRPD